MISKELIDALEKAETFDEFKAAVKALNLTEDDRVYLATCGIV
jgi:hypothetical protein